MADRVYRVVNAVGNGLMRALGLTVRVSGAEHLPSSGPVLLAATHVAYPDFVFIEKAAVRRDRYVRFMCRHDVWHKRWVGWSMDRMQHIPVDREAPAYSYLRARRLLVDGEAVGVFPEAGISYSYAVRPLMRGVASLARETGVPVVPVAVWGLPAGLVGRGAGAAAVPDPGPAGRHRVQPAHVGGPHRGPDRVDDGPGAPADGDVGVVAAAARTPAGAGRAGRLVSRAPRW